MAEPDTSNVLDGWREREYGRSRGGLPLRVQLPAAGAPVDGLLIAAQHGEEAETGLLARRLLERIPGDETRWAVVQVANPGWWNGDGSVRRPRSVAIVAARGDSDVIEAVSAAVAPSAYRPAIATSRSMPASLTSATARSSAASPSTRCASVST